MPTLEGLMRRGSFGLLTTRSPAKSPVIWTSVVTGKNSDKHGIRDFTRVEESGERVLYRSTDRTAKALWNILTDAEQSSVVLGWWTTFPVEEISGVIVSQANTLARVRSRRLLKPGGLEPDVAGQVYPPTLAEEVFAVVDEVERELPELVTQIFPAASVGDGAIDSKRWATCRWSVRADETVRRIAVRLARSRPFPDLVLVYFGTPDVVGHGFWRYHAPQEFRHPPSTDRILELGGVVDRAYERFDTVLGELMAEIPDQANVFVISDHGMRAKHVDLRFDDLAAGEAEKESGGHGGGPPGLIVAAGPAILQAADPESIRGLARDDLRALGDVLDITPTVLALRGLPIGRDMDGSIMHQLLAPDFRQALSPELIPTHDTSEWLAAQGRRARTENPHLEERLDQLRSLGYLD